MIDVEDHNDEVWFEHQPNVAVKEGQARITFYCADGSVHTTIMTFMPDGTPQIFADGHFVWADQWWYDLFNDLAIGGIAYWEGTNP